MMPRVAIAVAVVLLFAGGAAAWVTGWVDRWMPGAADSAVVATVGTIDQRVVAIGRVEPFTEVTIANKIPGRIKAVLVGEGDAVTVGQPLIRFESDEYDTQVRMARARANTTDADVRRAQRALETAQARLAEAKSGARAQEVEVARADVEQATQRWQTLELTRMRVKRLYEASLVARSEYEQAESEAEIARARIRSAQKALELLRVGPKPEVIASAQAQVSEAEAELKRAESQVAHARAEVDHMQAVSRTTVVQSTVNGKVTRKLVEPGEAVDIGIPLLVLGDMRKIIVKAEVDETEIGQLAVGQRAQITADAYAGRVFSGVVYEMGQTVGKRRIRPEDPTRMQDMKILETKIEVTDGADVLKLGMTVDVKILVAYKERALVIPKRLVPPGASKATVQVASAGAVEPRAITLGTRDDEKVEVLTGLASGDRVLTKTAPR